MLASMGTSVFAAEATTTQTKDVSAISSVSPKWHASFLTQNLILRSGAGNNYSSLGQQYKNDYVSPTFNTAYDSNGMQWSEVYSDRYRRNGWVLSKYITYE